jgi:hypothetical protein
MDRSRPGGGGDSPVVGGGGVGGAVGGGGGGGAGGHYTDSYDYLFKFLVIGSAGTGKSCLLHQFIEGRYKEDSSHTIGVEFGSKIVPVGGKTVKLQVRTHFFLFAHLYKRTWNIATPASVKKVVTCSR